MENGESDGRKKERSRTETRTAETDRDKTDRSRTDRSRTETGPGKTGLGETDRQVQDNITLTTPGRDYTDSLTYTHLDVQVAEPGVQV